jgi:phosphohistidine phosphatase
MKRLFVCRHAKSSWKDSNQGDFDRPLNKRGEHDAPEMGRRLASSGFFPDLICSSPAMRAMTTAQLYAGQLGYPLAQIRYNPLQYTATVPMLMQLLQEVEENIHTLMLVGHNPESTALANILGGLMIDNIPTAGIVALEFGLKNWRDMCPGAGTLLFFDYPKKQGG